jgi:hypothetical protein
MTMPDRPTDHPETGTPIHVPVSPGPGPAADPAAPAVTTADVPDPGQLARTKRQLTVAESLSTILTTLRIDPRNKEAVLSGMSRRFGRALPRVARLLADALSACPEVFQGQFPPPDTYRALEDRLLELSSTRPVIADFEAQIAGEERAAANRLAELVGGAYDHASAWLKLKGTDPDTRKKLADFMAKIDAVLKERNDQAKAAREETIKAKKELSSTRSKLTKTELENRFLSGEELSPDDLEPGGGEGKKPTRRGRKNGRTS